MLVNIRLLTTTELLISDIGTGRNLRIGASLCKTFLQNSLFLRKLKKKSVFLQNVIFLRILNALKNDFRLYYYYLILPLDHFADRRF